jgi:nucleoside-diphosphate-sugar epimerase
VAGDLAAARALSNPVFLADRPLEHALVLGGTGFLGAPLVRRLCAAGVRTTCLLHRSPLPAVGAATLRGSLDRFPWRTLEADPPDVIFHFARIAGRGGIRGAATRVRNRVANERLLLHLVGWSRPPLVVYVGGTLVYGSHGDEPVTEQTPLAPTSFSRDYHHAEVPWLRAQRGNDAPVIVARPAWVLGPGSWFEAYYRRFLRTERAVPLYGPGDNWMSIVHVDDCAGLLEHAARRAPPMSIVNVFAGAPLQQVELAERVARVAALPIRRVSLDDLERRCGRAVREAFDFSARISTVHQALHAGYQIAHHDLDGDLAALLGSTIEPSG